MIRQSRSRLSLVFVGTLATLVSCGIHENKPQPTINPEKNPITNDSNLSYSYAQIRDAVITPSCVSCHGSSQQKGGVRLDSYSAVIANLDLFKSEIIDGQMPPDSPIVGSLANAVSTWVSQGAPEVAYALATPTPSVSTSPTPSTSPSNTPAPVNTPVPGPTPTIYIPGMVVTYPMVRDTVFNVSCTKCHGAVDPDAGVRLDSYAEVIANIEGVNESILDGSMPDDKPLNANQMALVLKWIEQGTKENGAK